VGVTHLHRLAFHPFNSSAVGRSQRLANFPNASVSLRTLFGVDLLDQLLRGRIVDGQDRPEPARTPVKNLDRNRMLDPTADPRPGRARSGHCCAARPVHRYFVRFRNYRHGVSPYIAFSRP